MYETLINRYNECMEKALFYFHKGDFNLATFYKKASIGFKNKADSLTIMEV